MNLVSAGPPRGMTPRRRRWLLVSVVVAVAIGSGGAAVAYRRALLREQRHLAWQGLICAGTNVAVAMEQDGGFVLPSGAWIPLTGEGKFSQRLHGRLLAAGADPRRLEDVWGHPLCLRGEPHAPGAFGVVRPFTKCQLASPGADGWMQGARAVDARSADIVVWVDANGARELTEIPMTRRGLADAVAGEVLCRRHPECVWPCVPAH